jgi:hypothetical protein
MGGNNLNEINDSAGYSEAEGNVATARKGGLGHKSPAPTAMRSITIASAGGSASTRVFILLQARSGRAASILAQILTGAVVALKVLGVGQVNSRRQRQ